MIGRRRFPAAPWVMVMVMVMGLLSAAVAQAQDTGQAIQPIPSPTPASAPTERTGRDVYRQFREGLAQPECAPDASTRWRSHFAAAPKRLASDTDDLLPLFAYVVDALREASLPTEYALIPFVESGYKPGARSPLGPTGLWQMIAVTARNHKVPIRKGYDGRLSPVDSTRAAVRYLKTLHGMFAGDWRLAAMAYNAGEYRIFGSLKHGGQVARDARPEQLPGLAPITHAYVRKLHALSCVLTRAEENEAWMRALDRPVPALVAITLPPDIRQIDRWATSNGQVPAQLGQLNPVLAGARPGSGAMQLQMVSTPSNATRVLPDPGTDSTLSSSNDVGLDESPVSAQPEPSDEFRLHTVLKGDNISTIARRYDVRIAELLERNRLTSRSVLRPGHVLHIGAAVTPDEPAAPDD
ncbi:MAG: transglycosylase SLT domain-containing protein, partial [Pseudomonadota bacterium]|nr:transglycosylase SLT domain-containing protein [Pseudomonadota bacterium]